MSERKHLILNPADVQWVSTGHSNLQFLASPEDTSSRDIAVLQGIVPAGGNVPLHSHADPECFFVLEGEMEVYQDQNGTPQWGLVKTGGFAVMHSNVKHAWRNLSSKPCRCLIITGADVFAFLRGACDLQQKAEKGHLPQEATVPSILTLAEQTHGWLATPEENAAIGLKLT